MSAGESPSPLVQVADAGRYLRKIVSKCLDLQNALEAVPATLYRERTVALSAIMDASDLAMARDLALRLAGELETFASEIEQRQVRR